MPMIISLLCSLLIPAIAMADGMSCPGVVKKLYDISNNEALRASFFDSASIALFEESLGQGDRNLTPDSMIEYKWTCPEDNTSTISVITKDGTHVLSFSGVLKTKEDSITFSANAAANTNKSTVGTNNTEQPAQLY